MKSDRFVKTLIQTRLSEQSKTEFACLNSFKSTVLCMQQFQKNLSILIQSCISTFNSENLKHESIGIYQKFGWTIFKLDEEQQRFYLLFVDSYKFFQQKFINKCLIQA